MVSAPVFTFRVPLESLGDERCLGLVSQINPLLLKSWHLPPQQRNSRADIEEIRTRGGKAGSRMDNNALELQGARAARTHR